MHSHHVQSDTIGGNRAAPPAPPLSNDLCDIAFISLRASGLAIGLLFLLIAISHGMNAWTTTSGREIAWSVFTAVVAFVVAGLASMRVWPLRAAHMGFALIAATVLVHIVVFELTHQTTYNTIRISLFIATFSLISYSPRWWIAMVAAAVASWILILRPSVPAVALETNWAIIASATTVSAIIMSTRISTLRRLEGARVSQLQRTREFELAVDALQQTETQFLDLFNHSPDAVFIEDYEGNVLNVNPAACRLHGMTREQLLKCNVIDLVPPRLRETISTDYPKLVRGTWEQVEGYSYTADGREIPVEVRVSHISYQGKPALLLHARDITQRITAASALRESEARQRKILDSLPMALYTAPPTYPKSDALEWVTRHHDPESEAPLHSLINDETFWTSRIHPDDLQRVLDTFDQLQNKDSVSVEYRWQCPDGSYRWFLDQPTLVRDESGEPYQIIGTWVDVTERKMAEKELRESESRFRLLVEHAADAFFLHTLEGTILDVNQKACLSLGYSREQLLNMSMAEVDVQYSTKRLTDSIELMELGLPMTFESNQRHQNGSTVPVEMRSALIEYEGRSVVLGLARDISERKRTEAELLKQTQLMEGICRNMPVIVCRIDANGVFQTSAGGGLRRLGLQDGELVGKNIADIYPEYDHWIQRAIAGEDVHYEASGEHEGEPWAYEVFLTPDKANNDGILGFSLDVTERRLAETERRQLADELRQAQKLEAIGTLAAGVAHDFNNVITAITAYVKLAVRSLEPSHPAQRHLEMIEQGARQASYVTQSLLTFAHRNPSERQAVNLVALVDDAARLLHRLMPASIDLQADLPLEPAIWIQGEEGQLQRVLMNLAVNARDVMPDGGAIRISLKLVTNSDGEQEAQLTVSDNGPGMDAQTLERVFEPFYTTHPRGKGTGLGLAVVHGIVADHGARIDVDSSPQCGTRVTIWLKTNNAAPIVNMRDNAPRTARGKLLLLVKSEYVGQIMATVLEVAGYDPTMVTDLHEARALFDASPSQWAAMVIDWDMPAPDLHDQIGHMTASRPDMPILPISSTPEVRTNANTSDIAPLVKPFEMAALVHRVDDMVINSIREEKVS